MLVDAEEALLQTKFKARPWLGLRPIVLNKVDRPHADPDGVLNDAFDLFAAIGATDEQLDFPHLYASGKQGWAVVDMADERKDLAPLFDKIVSASSSRRRPRPTAAIPQAPRRAHRGRPRAGCLPGRWKSAIDAGRLSAPLARDGTEIERQRLVTKLLAFRGLKRASIDVAEAGDIVAVAGMTRATVADTLAALDAQGALPAQPIDPPTIAITVSVNDSPLAGRDGDKVQSRVIRERLLREAEANVAVKVSETSEKDAFEVAGRGELQLGVLIESMRREGFEVSISRPRVVFQTDAESGARLEPIEEVVIDVDEDFAGVVIEKLSARKAENCKDMGPSGAGKTRLTFQAPSRALIGYQGEFLTDTRGSGVLNRVFSHYEPYKGLPSRAAATGPLFPTRTARPRPSPCGTWKIGEPCSWAPGRRPTKA